MRLRSAKFKYLEQFSAFLPEGVIPDFEIISQELPELEGTDTWILRSALKHEAATGRLNSGKSISISDIDSRKKLQVAWENVRTQMDFTEAILQRQMPWESHITAIYQSDFLLLEVRSRAGEPTFAYRTPMTETKNPLLEKISDLLEPLKPQLDLQTCWLLELGHNDHQIFLFQIHPVDEKFITDILDQDLVKGIVSSRMRFGKKQNLFQLLKTEWQARLFRRRFDRSKIPPGDVFINWEYLFHYFRIFCMSRRLSPDEGSFARFLSSAFSRGWPSELVKAHLEIAGIIRKDEAFTVQDIGFRTQKQAFIGKGVVSGEVGKDILIMGEPDLSLIYSMYPPKAFLTKKVGLLSHAVLACAEKNIGLVVGHEGELQSGDIIYLDFDQQKIMIKS
jgi:hypothetical protein